MLVGIIGLHCMLEFPLWLACFLGVAALAVGLGSARHASLPLRRIAPAGVFAILVAGVANAAVLVYEYRQFEKLTAIGLRHPAAALDALAALAERDVVTAFRRPRAE